MAKAKKVAKSLVEALAPLVAEIEALPVIPSTDATTTVATEVAPEWSEADQKAVEMEAAWASHNAVDPEAPRVPTAEEVFAGQVYVEIDGKRYLPDGKQIYLLNRDEIEECYQRCVVAKRKPKVIFSSKEEIDKCAAETKARKDAAIKSKREKRIAEALADGKYHSLGALQMLTGKAK